MAKKHFGALVVIAAAAGAAAAGISYFLKYKSFHKELEEEFHDFEDDSAGEKEEPAERTYVSLTPDKAAEEEAPAEEASEDDSEDAPAEPAEEEEAAEKPEAEKATTTIEEAAE